MQQLASSGSEASRKSEAHVAQLTLLRAVQPRLALLQGRLLLRTALTWEGFCSAAMARFMMDYAQCCA